MSKIAVITKNFPRHFDFVVSLMETGFLSGVAMVIDEDNTAVKNNETLNNYYLNSEHKFFGNKFNNIGIVKLKIINIIDIVINVLPRDFKFFLSFNNIINIIIVKDISRML